MNVLKSIICIIVFILFFSTCGIEEYIYLKEVESFSSNELDQYVDFTLPEQNYSGFKNYKLYYRIYLDFTYPANNPAISSDLSRIIQINETPSLLESVLNSLFYREIEFGEDDTSISKINNPLTATASGKTFKINFKVSDEKKYIRMYDSNNIETYRLFRNTSVVKEEDSDFLYYKDINGEDITNYSLYEPDRAYAQLIIVAIGMDSNLKTFMSKATKLCVIELSTRD